MSTELTSAIIVILTAIIGVAIIATLVSPQAQTSNVIKSGGSVLTSLLSTAINPFSGSNSGSTIASNLL